MGSVVKSVFGGGDSGMKAAQARQEAMLAKQQKELDRQRREEERRKSSRNRLLAAIQGRSNTGTLFATSAGVQGSETLG